MFSQLKMHLGLVEVGKLGGSTAWKLGPEAAQLTNEARRRGLTVHMGRVNSRQRLRYAAAIGCQSADGTHLAFSPDRNLPKLLGWLAELGEVTQNLATQPRDGAVETLPTTHRSPTLS